MRNSNGTVGNRTRDLPTCSAVPQPTALPRAPFLIFIVRKYKTLVNITYLKRLAATPMLLPVQFLMVLTAIIRHVTPTAPLFGGLHAHGASFVYHRVLKWYMMLSDITCGRILPEHFSDRHYRHRMSVSYVGSPIYDFNFGTLCTNYLGAWWRS